MPTRSACSVQRLNPARFIVAEDDGFIRRLEIQPHDIAQIFGRRWTSHSAIAVTRCDSIRGMLPDVADWCFSTDALARDIIRLLRMRRAGRSSTSRRRARCRGDVRCDAAVPMSCRFASRSTIFTPRRIAATSNSHGIPAAAPSCRAIFGRRTDNFISTISFRGPAA